MKMMITGKKVRRSEMIPGEQKFKIEKKCQLPVPELWVGTTSSPISRQGQCSNDQNMGRITNNFFFNKYLSHNGFDYKGGSHSIILQ